MDDPNKISVEHPSDPVLTVEQAPHRVALGSRLAAGQARFEAGEPAPEIQVPRLSDRNPEGRTLAALAIQRSTDDTYARRHP